MALGLALSRQGHFFATVALVALSLIGSLGFSSHVVPFFVCTWLCFEISFNEET